MKKMNAGVHKDCILETTLSMVVVIKYRGSCVYISILLKYTPKFAKKIVLLQLDWLCDGLNCRV